MKVGYYLKRLLMKLYGAYVIKSNIDKKSKVESLSQVVDSSFGRYSYCGYGCKIINTRIGKFCSIADNVIIGGATHPLDWVSTSPAFYYGRDSIDKKLARNIFSADITTIIEDDVWIGDCAMIKSGITISTGAVIGMGAVITKNIGPYEIWAGNPARLIKKRFDDDTITKLLASKWWDREDKQLVSLSKKFNDVDDFLGEV